MYILLQGNKIVKRLSTIILKTVEKLKKIDHEI